MADDYAENCGRVSENSVRGLIKIDVCDALDTGMDTGQFFCAMFERKKRTQSDLWDLDYLGKSSDIHVMTSSVRTLVTGGI